MLRVLNYHHCHLVLLFSRNPEVSKLFSTIMHKRRSNAIEEKDALRRSTRVTKKAKLAIDAGEEEVKAEVTSIHIDKELAVKPSSTKKGKAKAADTDIIDVSSLPERVCSNWKVGAHVSAAGGVENAVFNAAKIGANAFALFVKSQRKWSSPPLTDASISSFKSRMKQLSYNPKYILPHGSYLINLGNPDTEKREKSYECFLDDLKRCDSLGLELYNFHPGSSLGIVEPSVTMTHIADCINRSHRDTPGSKVVVVLENMAGSGNIIGSDFAHLGEIIGQVDDKTRVGVCLDTCHMFAAGYDIRTKEGWNSTVESFDTHVGLKYLRGMHLNDSKTACGSKKDRHDNIGVGHLSIQTFAHILTDPRMQDIPLILETPSHEGSNKNWDVWVKEIEVLNLLSVGTNSAVCSSPCGKDAKHASEVTYDLLARGIKDVIQATGSSTKGGKSTKSTLKKSAKDAAPQESQKVKRGRRRAVDNE
ncbi:xylose isomerase-like protein [Lentinula guzmanii]|uniref:Apurinic-apyrimidinic endonuclease 1 n=1 Tax=Lentinula guzmanii TaxID=2804957 RepID=A0AA38JQK4_9AGAR|nr:xylose isomerase-like protein [Lentinula guzmanii]